MIPFVNLAGRTRIVRVIGDGAGIVWQAVVPNNGNILPPHDVVLMLQQKRARVEWEDAEPEPVAVRPTKIYLEDGPFDGEERDLQEDPICPTLVIPFVRLSGSVEQVHYRFWAQLEDPPVLLYRWDQAESEWASQHQPAF